MAGSTRTHNTFEPGAKLQHRWEQAWPDMRTVMTPNPELFDGEEKAQARHSMSNLYKKKYRVVEGLTQKDLLELCDRDDQLLMQCTNEQWEINKKEEHEQNRVDSVTTSELSLDMLN